VDILVANEAEARSLLNDDRARDLPADGLAGALTAELAVPTVVVTLGESGCVAHTDGVIHRYPAQEMVAVDTTGAGDAFMATYAAHVTAGAYQDDAINAAQSAAAQAIQHAGGHESMPSSGWRWDGRGPA
jgi:ribokinase